MFFREYDPALGRMNAVDPMASKYASLTPYNYAFNDPVYYNDPLGDDASSSTRGGYSYASMGGCGCWRDSGPQDASGGTGMYGSSWNYETYGGGFGRYGVGVSTGLNYYKDANAVRNGQLTHAQYAQRHGVTMGSGIDGLSNAMVYLGAVEYDANTFTFEFGGKTYGGIYHTTNGKVSSAAMALVIQSNSGGWEQSGRIDIIIFNQKPQGTGRGSAKSFSFGFAFVFGISGEWGVVSDETGNSRGFWTVSANFGLGLDIGINNKEIIPSRGNRFRIEQYEGRGKNLSFGAMFTSEARGGNTPGNPTLDPTDFGGLYKERTNNLSPFIGLPVSFRLGDVGVIYQMSKTSFFKQ